MIDRRDFLKITTGAATASLFGSGPAHAGLPAPSPSAPPQSVDAIRFVNGALSLPSSPRGPNNRGVLTDQTLPGMTHIEIYLNWARVEPERDGWNLQEFDEMLALSQQRGLKILLFPNVNNTPDWLKRSGAYQPVVNSRTGESFDFPSPWAPGSDEGFDHFYAFMADRYGSRIDIIKYFIEVGLMSGKGNDFWCGDRFARADFRQSMTQRHDGLAGLNAAWGTRFASAEEIDFPTSAKTVPARRWVDFIGWYQESQVRALRRHLQVIRRHFPQTHIDVPMGFGSDIQRDGCDRTAICAAAAAFPPISIRSTHGSFNRDQPPRAYWFYKRMAPVCHALNIGFGTEPPGGDLTYREICRQYFEDASAGATLIFQYYQNFHLRPQGAPAAQAIADYKRILRPGHPALIDIAVLYPTTQMVLDMTPFPPGQIAFCAQGRSFFDYDLADENMIGWDLLKRYRVLLHTDGRVFRQSTLTGIDRWLRDGGVMITMSVPAWESLETRQRTDAAWMTPANRMAVENAEAFAVGKGLIVSLPSAAPSEYLTRSAALLADLAKPHGRLDGLRGFKGRNDGTYDTHFADGRLSYDATTGETSFHPG